jgi:hypothetical protein
MTPPTIHTPDDPVEAVLVLVRLATKAQREGLPSLLEEAQRADSQLLRDGLRLTAEGRPAAEVQAAMGRQITDAAPAGETGEIVRRMVAAGILAIRDGASPAEVRESLVAFLSPEERSRLEALPGPGDVRPREEELPGDDLPGYESLPAPVQRNLTAEQWAEARRLVVPQGQSVPETTQYLNLKDGQLRIYDLGETADGPLLAAHNLAGGRGRDSDQFRTAPRGAPRGT